MRIFDSDKIVKIVNIDIYAHSISQRRISIKNKYCMEFNLFWLSRMGVDENVEILRDQN